MKTIKLFDGVKVTTADEIKKYPDMTVFDECIKCTEEQRKDIVQSLMCFHTLDLTSVAKQRLILDLYSE
jgi:hypothetical protein